MPLCKQIGSGGGAPAELYQASTHAPSRRLVVLPGQAHGTDLLKGAAGTRARTLVLEFLRQQSHAG